MYGISRKTATKAGATGIAALAIVGAVASASSAAALTYTVSVGAKTSGTTAKLSGTSNGSITFKDITTGLNATCASATAKGTAPLGTARAATAIAQIISSTYTSCSANGQLPLTIKQTGKWKFQATGATAGGVTPGKLTAIAASVTSSATNCAFLTKGTVDGSYNNNGTLSFGGGSDVLVISNQSGNCLGLANNGDQVTLTASYSVVSTAPSGTLSVVSN